MVLLVGVCALAFFTVIVPLVLGAQSYTVLTGSMRPALEPGHLIAVRATPIDEIKPGDIVTFQIESGRPEVATHRVVGVGYSGTGERLLTTQGDANNVQDANPVQEVQIRGVLVYAVPWVGYLNVWATPAVKSIVVTIVGIGAIGWGIIVFLKDAKRRRRLSKASAVAATLAIVVLSPSMAPMAHAVTAAPLLLSADGVTWTAGSDLRILDAADRLVPGAEIPLNLWVRNTSTDPAEFTVTGSWSPTTSTDPGDVALAGGLIAPRLEHQSIGPNDSVQARLTVGLAADSGLSTRTASANLTVTVTMTQTGTAALPDEPLARTGASAPAALIITATGLVGAGVVLLLTRTMTHKRRNRRDR